MPLESGYAQEKIFSQESAIDRAINWANSLDDCVAVETIYEKDLLENGTSRVRLLLEAINSVATTHSAVYTIFAWADCPFLNKELTNNLVEYHEKYRAEYTFAEGFPYGFAPELIHTSTLSILSELVATRDGLRNAVIARDSLFNVIKVEINSFEIETFMADEDWRYLRLQFCCNNKRNSLACERLFDIADDYSDAHTVSALAESCSSIQRTLPAFYAIQIHSVPFQTLSYEPAYGEGIMELKSFEKLVSKIQQFSDDAIISLSFLSDPLYHENFLDFVKIVLESKNTSLIIETDGLNITQETIQSIATMLGKNEIQKTGQLKLNWIVKIDANDEDSYKKAHLTAKDGDFLRVLETVQALKTAFPSAVYPQFTRTNANEQQLEGFFRKWTNDGSGQLIVQKFDHISGMLSDERPADLTPAKRYPCWHIKRDMCILANGTVVRCKAAAFNQNAEVILGNTFEEELATIWARGEINLIRQLDKNYKGQCEKSDEWYTFNF